MKKLNREQIYKWIMTLIFLISALVVSSNLPISKYAYILFGIGHIMGMYVFWKYKDNAMFYNNCIFLLIDSWGIYRWMF